MKADCTAPITAYGFARHAHQQRHPDIGELVQPPEQLQVVIQRFSETESGIDKHVFAGDAGGLAGVNPPSQKFMDLGH